MDEKKAEEAGMIPNPLRKKVSSWIEDHETLIFMSLLIFAIVLRFYYFWITKSQPLWWDESEYMSGAKALAGLVNYDLGGIRSPLFPAMMSIFFFLHIGNEAIIRFFGLFIPSILVIVLTYFMIREMYNDKRVAIISTLIMTVLWEHLFYSNRFHTENMALIFEFLAIFILFGCYLKNKDFYFIKSKYSLIWILAFSVLAFLFRPGNIMFVPAIILFINRKKILSKAGLISAGLIVLAIIASFLFSDIPQTFLEQYTHFTSPIGWNSLTVFYGFFQSISNMPSVLFYAFIIGIVIILFKTILILDQVLKLEKSKENLEFKSDIFNLLLLAIILFIFIFIMRANSFEYRWFFPLLPAMLAFTSKGVLSFSDYLGKLGGKKIIATILIILIVIMGVYSQFDRADQIIKSKVDSYSQIRDAGLWLKENSGSSEKVLTVSSSQTTYYSELNVSSFTGIDNETAFNDYLEKNNPRFLELTAFETQPAWMSNWLTLNENRTIIAKYFTMSTVQGERAVVIIYELKY